MEPFAEVRGHGGPRSPDEGTAFPRGEGGGPGSSLGGGEAGKVRLNGSSCVGFCRDQTRKICIVRDPAKSVYKKFPLLMLLTPNPSRSPPSLPGSCVCRGFL